MIRASFAPNIPIVKVNTTFWPEKTYLNICKPKHKVRICSQLVPGRGLGAVVDEIFVPCG